MARPRIALTTSSSQTPESLAARRRYIRALQRAGADVLEVPPGSKPPRDIAGLCLSGGGDIAPKEYGASDLGELCRDIDEARDGTELEMARHALAQDLPILGVCRGFQMLNVVFDGTLVQDVTGHRAADHARHVVTPAKGSLLARACGDGEMAVNSRHHQAVTRAELGRGLRPTAFVGALVEAFESTTHRWVVGEIGRAHV